VSYERNLGSMPSFADEYLLSLDLSPAKCTLALEIRESCVLVGDYYSLRGDIGGEEETERSHVPSRASTSLRWSRQGPDQVRVVDVGDLDPLSGMDP